MQGGALYDKIASAIKSFLYLIAFLVFLILADWFYTGVFPTPLRLLTNWIEPFVTIVRVEPTATPVQVAAIPNNRRPLEMVFVPPRGWALYSEYAYGDMERGLSLDIYAEDASQYDNPTEFIRRYVREGLRVGMPPDIPIEEIDIDGEKGYSLGITFTDVAGDDGGAVMVAVEFNGTAYLFAWSDYRPKDEYNLWPYVDEFIDSIRWPEWVDSAK